MVSINFCCSKEYHWEQSIFPGPWIAQICKIASTWYAWSWMRKKAAARGGTASRWSLRPLCCVTHVADCTIVQDAKPRGVRQADYSQLAKIEGSARFNLAQGSNKYSTIFTFSTTFAAAFGHWATSTLFSVQRKTRIRRIVLNLDYLSPWTTTTSFLQRSLLCFHWWGQETRCR